MYEFRLYIASHNEKTDCLIQRLRETMDRQCKESYHLEVLDIFENLDKVYEDNVFVTPTLIKITPLPSARVVGDLSAGERVLTHLQVGPISS